MKKLICVLGFFCIFGALFAQSDDELFGSDDDFFFSDDGIEELETVEAKSDLAKGVLFENGSIKIGGSFTSTIETTTILYDDSDADFVDNFCNTKLNPNVGALISVDARPNQDLRMYSKFGFRYPFYSKAVSSATTTEKETQFGSLFQTDVNTTVSDWIYLKEMFTDFSLLDRAFFRFGLHTVTWGTGYFFSPVSDIINTTSINPEDVDAQVDGCFNLRTQITFPGTQNCLWLYVLPSFDYAKNTALAGKFDLVLGGWELGFGGYLKYKAAPKVTLTATGSVKKFNIFAEGVYQYGSDREWIESQTKEGIEKSHQFKATAGFSYMWKDPAIVLAAQYLYDGNDFTLKTMEDMMYLSSNPLYIKENLTQGHNVAAMVNFGKIFGSEDVTAMFFAMANFGKADLPDYAKNALAQYGAASFLNAGTISAMLYYAPTASLKLGLGPYITFADWEKDPTVALKLSVTLGGGNF